MSKLSIHGVTISIDMGDKDYGNGQSCFMNLQGRFPEPGKPIEELADIVTDGLDMYFAAWKTLLAGRFSSGLLTSEEFKSTLTKVGVRVDKVRNYLRNNDGSVGTNSTEQQ